jgi:sarcosine oxidase delta subunit
MMMESIAHPQAMTGPLLPCPFCGGAAEVEADPWYGESARITCSNESCAVSPKTEYLLLRFADELRCAWNHRPGRARCQPAA